MSYHKEFFQHTRPELPDTDGRTNTASNGKTWLPWEVITSRYLYQKTTKVYTLSLFFLAHRDDLLEGETENQNKTSATVSWPKEGDGIKIPKIVAIRSACLIDFISKSDLWLLKALIRAISSSWAFADLYLYNVWKFCVPEVENWCGCHTANKRGKTWRVQR